MVSGHFWPWLLDREWRGGRDQCMEERVQRSHFHFFHIRSHILSNIFCHLRRTQTNRQTITVQRHQQTQTQHHLHCCITAVCIFIHLLHPRGGYVILTACIQGKRTIAVCDGASGGCSTDHTCIRERASIRDCGQDGPIWRERVNNGK